MTEKIIKINSLARVEGEGALELTIKNNTIKDLRLRIYEPPRLFEKFLEGRSYDELLDIVARICGICPVAYQMSATHAVEKIFHVTVSNWVREMRRLFYCGEWLSSHSLHIHFLAAPDFLGYANALDMAKDFPEILKRGIRLQDMGNKLIKLLGARSVHPVGACVGGFYQAPKVNEVNELLQQLKAALEDAEALIQWTLSLPLPSLQTDFIYVALSHATEYPMNEGSIVTSTGLSIQCEEFENYFTEYQVSYSTALHCILQGKAYLVGPLARLNLNYPYLPEAVKATLASTSVKFPSRNMFHSIIARAIEIYYALYESIRILTNYQVETPYIKVVPRAGLGFGCTEAPRGILWHRYELDNEGLIKSARIVSPTTQNQRRIEEDLRLSLESYGLDHDENDLRAFSEMIIRNYDPCISCSTHFLDLRITRL